MMSRERERELLKEIMSYFAKGDITIRKFENSSDVAETLHTAQELLAQPEHIPDIRNMAEPVAWMSKEKGDVNKSRSYFKFPEEHQHETIVPLYEHEGLTPRQGLAEYKRGYARAELDLKREPLSDKDIGKGFLLTDVWHRYECFIAGVKWAERQHGIGGGK